MAKAKVLIVIIDGIITHVCGNSKDIEIVTIDLDDNNDEPCSFSHYTEPEEIFNDGEAHKIFTESYNQPEEIEAKNNLIELNY